MAGRIAAGADPSPHLSPGDATASPASVLAADIKRLIASGERDQARERFGALVAFTLVRPARPRTVEAEAVDSEAVALDEAA